MFPLYYFFLSSSSFHIYIYNYYIIWNIYITFECILIIFIKIIVVQFILFLYLISSGSCARCDGYIQETLPAYQLTMAYQLTSLLAYRYTVNEQIQCSCAPKESERSEITCTDPEFKVQLLD